MIVVCATADVAPESSPPKSTAITTNLFIRKDGTALALPLPTTVEDPRTQQCLDEIARQFPIQGSNLAVGSAWQTPSLQNSWENYEAAGVYATAAYRRGVDGRVHLRGLVKRSVAGSNLTTIFTLPVGMRPSKQLLFVDGPKRVDVANDGRVIYVGGESTVLYLSLSNVSFYPD